MLNTWAAKIVSDEDGNDYYDLRQASLGSGNPPSSHAGLSDRDASGQHPDHAIALSGTHTGFLADELTIADAMTVLDDFKTGGMQFDNNKGVAWETVAFPGYYYGLGVDPNDDLVLGAGIKIAYGSTTVQMAGHVLLTIDDRALQGKDSGDVTRNIAGITSGGVLEVGDSALGLELYADGTIDAGANDIDTTGDISAGAVTLSSTPTNDYHATTKVYVDENFSAVDHGHGDDEISLTGRSHIGFLSGQTTVGGAMGILDSFIGGIVFGSLMALEATPTMVAGTIELIATDSSNHVIVGDTNFPLVLQSTGTIDAGANDIDTTGDISAGLVTAADGVSLPNNVSLLGVETGGSDRNLVKMGTSDVIAFG